MRTLIVIGAGCVVVGLYLWGRNQNWFEDFKSRAWALAGNSKTLLVAYAAELLGMIDELKLLDWSTWLGSERAGRVMVIMGLVMIGLRLVTRTAVSWRAQ